jgi:hypothetical protein
VPFAIVWNNSFPPDTQFANLLGQDLRDLSLNTMQRIASISGLLADRPTPEATGLTVDWTGVLYFTTDTNQIFRWSGAAWVDITSAIVGGTTILTLGGPFIFPIAAVGAVIWRAPFACTVTNVRGYRTAGTGATVNAVKVGVGDLLAADLSLPAADVWVDGGAVQNSSFAIGDALALSVRSVAGTPDFVSIQVELTKP